MKSPEKKSPEAEGPEAERPEAESPAAIKEDVAIGEEARPGPEQEVEGEKKSLSIIHWRVLSLIFMRFRHCFSFLSCLALAFLLFSSV